MTPSKRERQTDRAFTWVTCVKNTAPTGSAVLGVVLQPLACRCCGFESRRRHGCLSVLSVVGYQVEVSATSWSFVQRSPTECGWYRDLYLTTHNTHNRQTSMRPVGFEPTLPASELPQSHALDRGATGFDSQILCVPFISARLWTEFCSLIWLTSVLQRTVNNSVITLCFSRRRGTGTDPAPET
jgi:hypothetical protein